LIIVLMFAAVLIFTGRMSDALVGNFLLAIVGMGSGFIGMNVVDNRVKGKHFSQALWDATHPENGDKP
jgi:hypothetical protein